MFKHEHTCWRFHLIIVPYTRDLSCPVSSWWPYIQPHGPLGNIHTHASLPPISYQEQIAVWGQRENISINFSGVLWAMMSSAESVLKPNSSLFILRPQWPTQRPAQHYIHSHISFLQQPSNTVYDRSSGLVMSLRAAVNVIYHCLRVNLSEGIL